MENEKKKLSPGKIVLIVLASVFVGIPLLSGIVNGFTDAIAERVVVTQNQSVDTDTPASDEPATEVVTETLAQENARESAESYLNFSGFSRKGLINQLKYEEYSTEDAEYAVDNVEVDWNEEAAESAASYLEFSSFSRGELADQLDYEGFTKAQIEFALKSVGY